MTLQSNDYSHWLSSYPESLIWRDPLTPSLLRMICSKHASLIKWNSNPRWDCFHWKSSMHEMNLDKSVMNIGWLLRYGVQRIFGGISSTGFNLMQTSRRPGRIPNITFSWHISCPLIMNILLLSYRSQSSMNSYRVSDMRAPVRGSTLIARLMGATWGPSEADRT